MKVAFDVEQAGCESCGRIVGAALAPLGQVEALGVDEAADMASVVLVPIADADQCALDDALAAASSGAGHLYRIRRGSWREL